MKIEKITRKRILEAFIIVVFFLSFVIFCMFIDKIMEYNNSSSLNNLKMEDIGNMHISDCRMERLITYGIDVSDEKYLMWLIGSKGDFYIIAELANGEICVVKLRYEDRISFISSFGEDYKNSVNYKVMVHKGDSGSLSTVRREYVKTDDYRIENKKDITTDYYIELVTDPRHIYAYLIYSVVGMMCGLNLLLARKVIFK